MPDRVPDSHATVDVVICDAREFDRQALAAMCASDKRIAVRGVTGDTDELVGIVAASPGGVVVLVGTSMIRDHPALITRVRSAQATRLLTVGLEDAELANLVDQYRVDGSVRRDAPITECSTTSSQPPPTFQTTEHVGGLARATSRAPACRTV